MLRIKKRSEEEVNLSVKNKDYTGGYDFINWLLFMRRYYLLYTLGAGIIMYMALREESYGFVGFFLVIYSIFAFCAVRDYKRSKKGLSD